MTARVAVATEVQSVGEGRVLAAGPHPEGEEICLAKRLGEFLQEPVEVSFRPALPSHKFSLIHVFTPNIYKSLLMRGDQWEAGRLSGFGSLLPGGCHFRFSTDQQ